ncbi:MAG: sigma-70 family RNA polymerase sigma factor [Bacteroidales bacterium]|nr:sigma-70 family RNA polymerase sigma factor [Bacteroidales bacterium]
MKKERFLKMLADCEGIIFRACMYFTDRKPENVNDLYQEIVQRLWLSYPDFNQASKTSTWVYRIAVNTGFEHLRRKKSAPPTVSLTAEHYKVLADESGNALMERLYELIDRLEPDERMLIFLYLDRVPQADIAASLGLTVNSVRKRIQKIKEKLKQMNRYE